MSTRPVGEDVEVRCKPSRITSGVPHIRLHKGVLNNEVVAVYTDGVMEFFDEANKVYKTVQLDKEITIAEAEKWFGFKFSE